MSVYMPGTHGETVDIRVPTGAITSVPTPKLADWFLAAEDGKVTVYYLAIVDGGHDFRRVPTGIGCGQAMGALNTGGVGPVGAAGSKGDKGDRGENGAVGPRGAAGEAGAAGGSNDVDEATMQRIAALTAEQVLLGPPAADHYGLPAHAQFGTRLQETIAIQFIHQGFWQEVVKAIDEAAKNLLDSGYAPKVR